jgi:predicted house-cleaning noncanonical NTP pyrophosphatase (MazG superfamily)
MRRVFYNKLIRDNIPAKMDKGGAAYKVRKIDDGQEFEQELLKKVAEEASGLSRVKSREEFLSEYADLMAVLDALTRLMEFSEADIRTAIAENVEKKGGFKERIFLHWSEDSGYQSNETPQGMKQD